MSAIDLIPLLVGAVLLLAGRNLYWFFVGVTGFLAGFALASQYLTSQPAWMVFFIALLAGVFGSLLAVALQRLAVAIGGFLAGGYLALAFLNLFGWEAGGLTWLAFLLGGIIAAALVAAAFDWAIILLSSLIGATLVLRPFDLGQLLSGLAFVALLVIGIAVQASQLPRGKR